MSRLLTKNREQSFEFQSEGELSLTERMQETTKKQPSRISNTPPFNQESPTYMVSHLMEVMRGKEEALFSRINDLETKLIAVEKSNRDLVERVNVSKR